MSTFERCEFDEWPTADAAMKPPLRIVDTGLRQPRWNVAMTAAMAALHSSATRPSPGGTVRFHRYPACVLIGAGQDLAGAVDIGFCREAGIAIARRVTGGGAVYMSPGMLAWDVVVDRAPFGGDLASVTARVCGGVAAGFARLGVPARFRPANDIVAGGRKVSGSAGYSAQRIASLQGTVLIDDETSTMAGALRLDRALLETQLTCLAAEIGAAPALADVARCIAAGLCEALDRDPAAAEPHSDEIALCERLLREEVGTDAYVAGRAASLA